MGVDAPGPRITHLGIWLAVRLIGLPLLAALVLMDILIWAVAAAIWDICIGLWCWF